VVAVDGGRRGVPPVLASGSRGGVTDGRRGRWFVGEEEMVEQAVQLVVDRRSGVAVSGLALGAV
jgi:hypothetical protein